MRVVKTKALISFEVTAKLICAFVFAYAFFPCSGSLIFKPQPRHQAGKNVQHKTSQKVIINKHEKQDY